MKWLRSSFLSSVLAVFLAVSTAACTSNVGGVASEQSAAYYDADAYWDLFDLIATTSDDEHPLDLLSNGQANMVAAIHLAVARTTYALRTQGIEIPEKPLELVQRYQSDDFSLTPNQQAFCGQFLDQFPSFLEQTLTDFSYCADEEDVVGCALAQTDFFTPAASDGGAMGPMEQFPWLLVIVVVAVVLYVGYQSHQNGKERARAEEAQAEVVRESEERDRRIRELVERNTERLELIARIVNNNELDDEEVREQVGELLERVEELEGQ